MKGLLPERNISVKKPRAKMTQVNTFLATTDCDRQGRLLTGSINYAVSKLVVHELLQVKQQDSTHDFSVKLSLYVYITIVVAPRTYLSACTITYVYLVRTTPQLHEVLLTTPMQQKTVTNAATMQGLCAMTKHSAMHCSLRLVPQ